MTTPLDALVASLTGVAGLSHRGWFVPVFAPDVPSADRLRQRLDAWFSARDGNLLVLRPDRAEALERMLATVLFDPAAVSASAVWLEGLVDGPVWRRAWLNLLSRMNEHRDQLRAEGRGGLLLVMPAALKPDFPVTAPDLWSVCILSPSLEATAAAPELPRVPAPRPTASQLDASTLDDIYQLALTSGLADLSRRDLLLAWLPRALVARLPVRPSPSDQLRSDLKELNDIGPQTGPGEDPPLTVWLDNAARLSDYLPGVSKSFLQWRLSLSRQAAAARPAPPASSVALPRYDVFLAYPTAVRPIATELASALRAGGLTVFLDHDSLRPGDVWDARIPEALEAARLAILLIAAESSAAWYQQDEVAHAIERSRQANLILVPVLLDQAARAGLPYGLRRIQSIRLDEVGVQGTAAAVVRRLQDEAAPPT